MVQLKLFYLVFLIAINLYSPFSVLIPIVVNFIYASVILIRGKIKPLTKFEVNIYMFSFSLLCWVLLVSIANNLFSEYVIGRFARISLNTILLGIIIRNIKITVPQFLFSIGIALILNVSAIYLQTIFPSTKDFFMAISGFEKKIGELRSFGLYSSYDATGLNICLGISFWGLSYFYFRKLFYLIMFILTFLSSVFVSRYTMIVAGLLFMLFSFKLIFTYKIKKILLISPALLYVGYLFYDFVYPILYATINGIDIDGVSQSYGLQSGQILLNNMLFFPNDPFQFFLGTGEEPINSDIGYIKLLFMSGLFGLICISLFYMYIISSLKKKLYKYKLLQSTNIRILFYFLLALTFLMFIYNFKLLLLYGRGFHDLFIIMTLFINRCVTQCRPN